MSFRVRGLDPAPFAHLYGQDDQALAVQGARRVIANARPGFPDRVGLRDLEPGEAALLLNYVHQPADTAYRASHAIFVHEGAMHAAEFRNALPEVMRIRPLSLRAFDAEGDMLDAELVPGEHAEAVIERLLDLPGVAYLHAHYAKRGCYAGLIERL